jgi:uncharacterized OB-fold protein
MGDEAVQFMEQLVDLEYAVVASPLQRHFDEQLAQGRIIGHKCPACGLVYVPPKGFCSPCGVLTGDENEVEIEDRAIVTSFTVVTPIQYRGQQERDVYAQASLLLNGADSIVGTQRIEEIPPEQVRMGLRVKAVWRLADERTPGEGPAGFGFGTAIKHWVPTGEPDAERDEYGEHVF